MDILAVLILPVHVRDVFPLLSILVSSHQCHIFSYFTHRYFFLVVIINEISFWISFLDHLPLAYSSLADTCMLVSCPATLLNSVTSASGFVVVLLGFSLWRIVPFANSDTVWLLFQFGCPLFLCLIALARPFSTVLNENGEYLPPCLVLDRKMFLIFLIQSTVSW